MRRCFALTVVATTMLAGCAAPDSAPSPEPVRDVGVQLFQWSWNAIGAECPALADEGIAWVLTSPPQEHITGDSWWTSYQPVSYQIESRLGSREEFAAMVWSCHDAGVEVVADAVINHMAGIDAGVGTAGSAFTHYEYPGLYSTNDFHHCGLTPDDDIASYRDQAQVQTCELVNLADLDTGAPHVRDTIVAYLDDLLSLGVDGFRIDAAKHMSADDVAAIVAALPEDTRIISEVIRGAGEPVQPGDYTGFGHVFEFGWAETVSDLVAAGSAASLADLNPSAYGFVDSAAAATFVANHDTERNDSTLSVADPEWDAATAFMLASDYGTPVLYSGYSFDRANTDPGPVSEAACNHDAAPVLAGGDDSEPGTWTCAHAAANVVSLVEWRSYANTETVSSMTAVDQVLTVDRPSSLALINLSDSSSSVAAPTSMPDGTFIDAVSGAEVTVTDGIASATIDAWSTVAIGTWASA